jgi:hypothetical protein
VDTPSWPTDPTGKAFERRVTDAYRALGYQVTPNVEMPGKQTDLIARKKVDGAPPMVLTIECKDTAAPVGNATVTTFIGQVMAQRGAGLVSAGVLVSARGFTASARAAVTGHPYVALLSWDDLSAEVLDVRHQLHDLVASYERLAIFSNYVTLKIRGLSWSTLKPTEGYRETDLRATLTKWLARGTGGLSQPSVLFILADFGGGKTTLLRRLQWEQARAYLEGRDDRIPLFVPLRKFRESHDLATLLRASFRDSFYRDIPGDLLLQRLRSGTFCVYLDAFDEMVERSDPARRLELFATLVTVMNSASPTVLTSRPSYFVLRGEFDSLVSKLSRHEADVATRPRPAQRVAPGRDEAAKADDLYSLLLDLHRDDRLDIPDAATLAGQRVDVAEIRPLDRRMVLEFLEHHARELDQVGASAEAVLAFIERVYDLTDLASRPLLLSLIVKSVALGGLDINETASQYGAAGLYETYINLKLAFDKAKVPHRGEGLTSDLRIRLAEFLALRLYADRVLEVQFDGILTAVYSDPALGPELQESGLSRDEVATDFATSTFVSLDDSRVCRFVHKSFRGFFVARVLKDDLKHRLMSEPLEREVLYFLGGFGRGCPGRRGT